MCKISEYIWVIPLPCKVGTDRRNGWKELDTHMGTLTHALTHKHKRLIFIFFLQRLWKNFLSCPEIYIQVFNYWNARTDRTRLAVWSKSLSTVPWILNKGVFFPSLSRRINPGNTSCDLSFSLSLSCRGTVEARFVYVFVLGILFSGSKDLLRSQIITADAKLKSRGLWEIYSGLVLLVSLLFRAHNLPVLCCCLLIQTFMAQFIWKKLHYDAAQTTIMHYWFGQAFFFFQVGDKISDELMHVRFLRTVCHCGMNFPQRHRRAQVCRWLSRPSVCSVWKKKVFQLFVKIYFGFWTTSEILLEANQQSDNFWASTGFIWQKKKNILNIYCYCLVINYAQWYQHCQ